MRVGLLANIKPTGSELTALTAQLASKTSNVTDLFAEWDGIETVEAVRSALASHPDVSCEIIEALPNVALPKLQSGKYDIIFNIAEGFLGNAREAQFPALLEMLGMPYTGSGPLALAVALDKARTKEILSYHGIPVARFVTLQKPVGTLEQALPGSMYPVVVKPLAEGSSKGVKNSSFVNSDRELTQEILRIREDYNQPALVEEFLPGREFTVAVIGNTPNAHVLPIVEINFSELPAGSNKIYSYEAKWIYDVAENPLDIFSCPAELEVYTRKEIESVVLAAYETLECRDWSRIDVRMDARGRANIIEVNPLPGILPRPEENSCFPKAARAAGLSYEEMLLSVLKAGCDRYSIPFRFAPSLAH